MTNAEFARSNEKFNNACRAVAKIPLFENVKPTRRQASKYRREMGAAYKNERFLVRGN